MERVLEAGAEADAPLLAVAEEVHALLAAVEAHVRAEAVEVEEADVDRDARPLSNTSTRQAV